MAMLVIHRPGQVEETVHLPDAGLSVGRLEDNDLVIDERSISRHHARISPTSDTHEIVDLGSRNGVWVNGQRVHDTPVTLHSGDQVALRGRGVSLQYFADESMAAEATAFFPHPDRLDTTSLPDPWTGSTRWLNLLRVTPWLRLVGAAMGTLAAFLALSWWIIRFVG